MDDIRFFPETSRDDIKKALWVTVITFIGIFSPTLLGVGGFFTQTTAGGMVFPFLTIGAFVTLWKPPYETKNKLSEVMVFPRKTLLILFTALITGLSARSMLKLNWVASGLVVALFVSLIEFVLIYNLALYLAVFMIYLLRRGASSLSEKDRPVSVEFAGEIVRVTLHDGRMIATPLAWYPRLVAASLEQRDAYELSLSGIHWPELDEDLSVAGMLRGNRPPQPRNQKEVER